jgi:hypothetical protein
MAGLFFCAAIALIPGELKFVSIEWKGDLSVSEKTETNNVATKAAGLGISLDAWAVALALGLALLVWAGWIKRVPW